MNALRSWLHPTLAAGKWHSTLRSRAPQVAVWVLAVAIGVQAALIITRWAGSGGGPVTSVAQSTATSRPVDVAAITRDHLFGAAPEAAGGPGAPQTRLPLVLTGTLASEQPQDGLAILGANAAAVKVYAVGDRLPDGARLHAVYDDRVLLDRSGILESLMLLRGFPHPPANQHMAIAPIQRAVARVRRMMNTDPGALESVMRPQPFFSRGKLQGYRVYPGRNTRAFTSLGLRPGDLVIAIDGTPLDDPSQGEAIFRTLGSSSEAHVTVVRGGQQQDLTLDMAQIASEADQLTGENGAGGAAPPAASSPAGAPGRY